METILIPAPVGGTWDGIKREVSDVEVRETRGGAWSGMAASESDVPPVTEVEGLEKAEKTFDCEAMASVGSSFDNIVSTSRPLRTSSDELSEMVIFFAGALDALDGSVRLSLADWEDVEVVTMMYSDW